MSESTDLSKFRESIDFLNCLHFAIVNGEYSNIILKPKQVLCLEAAYRGNDLLAVLPTGYGKSLIFHVLSSLIREKNRRSDVLKKTGDYNNIPSEFADKRPATKDKSRTPKGGCVEPETRLS